MPPTSSSRRCRASRQTVLTPAEGSLARNLGAAVLHYARTGTLNNTTQVTTVTLPDGGGEVNLGEWLHDLRRGQHATGVGPADPGGAGHDRGRPRAPPADPAAAGPASQPGQARPRPVQVFNRVEVPFDQARRQEVVRMEGEAELGDAEMMVTGWRLAMPQQLRYRAESDQEFPWRDPGDPLNRVYAPYADAEGGLHPAVTARAARIGPVQGLAEMASDPQEQRLTIARRGWPTVRRSLEQEVRDLVQATIEGRHVPPHIQARILTADDVPSHEQALVGQHGAFLTEQALNAQGDQRPLRSHGQVLALYPAAVLDQPDAQEQWQETHPNFPTYAVDIPRQGGPDSLMSGEGYAGAAAFANTRLVEDAHPPAIDRSLTGTNALFVPFEVELSLPPGPDGTERTRWQPIMALVGLDNLYADHNPLGMVLADYGDTYLPLLDPPSPPVTARTPGTPPPP